ncbi:dicarboxylate/amino acid:cation symporter [Psychrobium sp. 1_MG-2023]|uniref:dicarboxylate/amino acid:cation symporter n=1 Tax=Psychrobium sp. 1_MG-2023 TaxID=3062624 RepID=UPI000C33CDE4|nr:dicarboxylate/amino acid:cation symporter [Psychrobium sp. 1_MG-2023]MDP2560204.1 dicarboxylate/amino acid:cation symporter [Psychrobium sp. 1_MG-2023]PKF57015.1 dicarboxylate/amino acid:cation symporter [Alteromonadales bacterium alter-6D02]
MSDKKPMSLTMRIVIGMLLGIVIGALIQFTLADNAFVKEYIVEGLFLVGGKIFVNSLKMLVVPLVFISLICGTCSLSDPSKLGRLGGKSILLYLSTTAIAITLAISLALVVSPGVTDGEPLTSEATFDAKQAPSLSQVLINIVPSNPIEAMAQGNMLQIILFALLLGVAISLSGESGKRVASLFNDLNEVVMKLVVILMNLAPYGVFFLMAKLFSEVSVTTIFSLGKYFLVVLFALGIHALITYPLLLKLLTGLNPVTFIKKMRDAALFAFSTASSNATIPVTLETATQKLGVNNNVASFTVPLGATINMDGTAIMQGVATVFIAQVFGVELGITDYLMVILTATLASVGTAGVPGVGLIMLAMVLQQVGLPVEGIALIIGVDRLLDMTRTAVNVTGDSMVTLIVGKSEKEVDVDTFNNPAAGKTTETL